MSGRFARPGAPAGASTPAAGARGFNRPAPAQAGWFGGVTQPKGDREPYLDAPYAYRLSYEGAYMSDDSGKPWLFVMCRVLETNDPNCKSDATEGEGKGEVRLSLHQCLSDKRVAGGIVVGCAMAFTGFELNQGVEYDQLANGGMLTGKFMGDPACANAVDAEGKPFADLAGCTALAVVRKGKPAPDGSYFRDPTFFPDRGPGVLDPNL